MTVCRVDGGVLMRGDGVDVRLKKRKRRKKEEENREERGGVE
jgi:hypothetical protein